MFYVLYIQNAKLFLITNEKGNSIYSRLYLIIIYALDFLYREEAAKLEHLLESASFRKKYMTKNYEKIFIY